VPDCVREQLVQENCQRRCLARFDVNLVAFGNELDGTPRLHGGLKQADYFVGNLANRGHADRLSGQQIVRCRDTLHAVVAVAQGLGSFFRFGVAKSERK